MKIEKINQLDGKLNLPGDKSISHRAIMFSALAKGKSVVNGFLKSEDIYSTINCFRNLGCNINEYENYLEINGVGFGNLQAPTSKLNCGNSGTTTRLISGILSAQNFTSVLFGDDSLSTRPMKRIIEPLTLMGAKIEASEGFKLPMKIIGNPNLHSIEYELPVASAQVKSCLILAALHIEEEVIIIEKTQTRNHTELMLNLNVNSTSKGNIIRVSRKNYPEPMSYQVPSDISSAAFFIVATVCSKNSEVIIENVSLNKTRTGIIEIIKRMGGDVEIISQSKVAGEEFGSIIIRSSNLHNVEIEKELIPNIIDEIPILSVAGFFAEGNFKVNFAEELRVKESDRINSICENFRVLGCKVDEYKDGFEIYKAEIKKEVEFKSYNDHRIAMAFYILGALLNNESSIDSVDSVKISNPEFFTQLKRITN